MSIYKLVANSIQSGEVVTSVGGQRGDISNAQLASLVTTAGTLTTANVSEVTNLYYTNARVYANVTQLNYATVSYVDGAVSNIIDSAPGVLDTLNEIAAAINDDPNFFSNAASLSSAAFNQANAAYDRANVAVTNAGASFDKANTLVASVAGVTSTSVSNVQLASGISQTGILTTANVIESGNLYYTVDRANTAIDNRVTKSFVEALGIDVPNNKITGNIISSQIEPTGVTPTVYGGASKVPVITIDTTGRITAASNVNVAGVSSFSATGNSFTISTADGGTFTANIQENSVRLGTDTTGAYVANLVQGNGIALSDLGSENATPTIALATSGVTANTYGGASKVPVITVDQYGRITSASNVNVAGVSTFNASGNTFTINTADGGSFSASIQENSVRLGTDTTGDYVKNVIPSTGITITGAAGESRDATIALENTSVTPSTYGGAASVGTFTVDQQGRLTSASNVSIAIPSSALTTDVALGTQTSGAYVSNLVAGTGVTITGLGNEGTTPTISIGQAVGTDNNVTFANVTVTGNLNVQGNAVIFESNTLVITDPLIQVGKNPIGDAVDLGFFGHYVGGSPSIERHAGLFRDATDGQFKLFTNLDPEPATIVDTANATYQSANLVVNFVVGKVSDISNHTTGSLTEGSSLYFTNARVLTAITGQTLTNATFSANVTADRFIAVNNGNGENYRVGDDLWIGDYNVANAIRIKGVQDSANAFINFGTGDTATLGRTGTGNLTYTAGFNAASLNATANVNAANVSVTSNTNTGNINVTGASRLGTVAAGTWNGSSISTTYTDAKITAVGGATGAVSNAQLATSISSSGLLTTANVSEVTNLYFTNARVYSNVTSIGYGKVTVSSTLPSNPSNGDKWVDLGNLIEFTYINDGNSSQWVQIGVPASSYDVAQINNAYNQANAAYNAANTKASTGKAIAMAIVFGG